MGGFFVRSHCSKALKFFRPKKLNGALGLLSSPSSNICKSKIWDVNTSGQYRIKIFQSYATVQYFTPFENADACGLAQLHFGLGSCSQSPGVK